MNEIIVTQFENVYSSKFRSEVILEMSLRVAMRVFTKVQFKIKSLNFVESFVYIKGKQLRG